MEISTRKGLNNLYDNVTNTNEVNNILLLRIISILMRGMQNYAPTLIISTSSIISVSGNRIISQGYLLHEYNLSISYGKISVEGTALFTQSLLYHTNHNCVSFQKSYFIVPFQASTK